MLPDFTKKELHEFESVEEAKEFCDRLGRGWYVVDVRQMHIDFELDVPAKPIAVVFIDAEEAFAGMYQGYVRS